MLLMTVTIYRDCHAVKSGFLDEGRSAGVVGFGHRRLRYPDGREIDGMALGVSPRRAATTLYLAGGLDEYADLLADLGRHTTGKDCLYVKRLDDLDPAVLRRILARSVSLATKA